MGALPQHKHKYPIALLEFPRVRTPRSTEHLFLLLSVHKVLKYIFSWHL